MGIPTLLSKREGEFFTHIHPAVVLIIWAPAAVIFLMVAVRSSLGAGQIVPGFLLGVFLWTLTEYLVHRFVFHFKPRSDWQEKIIFVFHENHHVQPQLKTRLVMPLFSLETLPDITS